MDERKKELLRAAHAIQEYCESRQDCIGLYQDTGECPLYKCGVCSDIAPDWKLPELERYDND